MDMLCDMEEICATFKYAYCCNSLRKVLSVEPLT